MTLVEAFDYAENELPEGWKIEIEIEGGITCISLHCPTWERIDFEDEGYGSIAMQIEAAVDRAIDMDYELKARDAEDENLDKHGR